VLHYFIPGSYSASQMSGHGLHLPCCHSPLVWFW